MNSCILMATVAENPTLRSTADNQMTIAEMIVEFDTGRMNEPMAFLKVIGWNNLAEEIKNTYHKGDQIIVQGRLEMNTIERAEGFKEKRAQLVASRIFPVQGSSLSVSNDSSMSSSSMDEYISSTGDMGGNNDNDPMPF
jgi:single-stranded DNA-binding protein